MTHIKAGIKPDMLAALRTAPLQMATIFPDSILKLAEDLPITRARVTLHMARVGTIPMNGWKESLRGNPTSLHVILVAKVRVENTRAGHFPTPPNQSRVSRPGANIQ